MLSEDIKTVQHMMRALAKAFSNDKPFDQRVKIMQSEISKRLFLWWPCEITLKLPDMIVPLAGFFNQYRLSTADELFKTTMDSKRLEVAIPPVFLNGNQFNTVAVRDLFYSQRPMSMPTVNKEAPAPQPKSNLIETSLKRKHQ